VTADAEGLAEGGAADGADPDPVDHADRGPADTNEAFRLVGERSLGAVPWRAVAPVVATFEGPGGVTFERFVVRSPGAVCVVPVLHDVEGTPMVVMVRQYRPSVAAWMWEVPAGMRDVPGEAPEATAQRELAEEAGYRAGRLLPLTRFHPLLGLSDSLHHLFLGLELEPAERSTQSEEEHLMEVHHVPLAEALLMCDDGRITDGKTILGLLLADRYLREGA
jgi:8-oxo-dGTP pyrophosphatase MutT (NUDIX family)